METGLLMLIVLGMLILLILFIISIFNTMTAKVVNNTIDKDTTEKLYEIFCNSIKGVLKAPTTAIFCKENELIIKENKGIYYVSGWVDSQNSYGAMIRTNIRNFKIKNDNGVFVVKSNAGIMASNSLFGKLAGNYIVALIFTIISFFVFFFIISSMM